MDGITFRIAPGEVVGFLGPNGAGKTTTLKMLSGHDASPVTAHDGPWDRGLHDTFLAIDRAPRDGGAGVYVSHMCTLTLVL